MRFTRFLKLKQAIAGLDVHFIANKIHKLEDRLSKHGITYEPENTAITEEGIFYIDPESGMATRIVLYESDFAMNLKGTPKRELYLTGYTDKKVVEKFHDYHLLRCGNLTDAERSSDLNKYRIAQREFPSFYFRIVRKTEGPVKDEDIYQEIENQKLLICPRCFMKINSLLDHVFGQNRESFELQYFFNVDFYGEWCRYSDDSIPEHGALGRMNPKDWEAIVRIRKEQVNNMCESCQHDFSDPMLNPFLDVYPTDHVKRKVGYVKLECLCLGCLAEFPDRESVKETPLYEDFLIRTGLKESPLQPDIDEGQTEIADPPGAPGDRAVIRLLKELV